jgi:hypothetical protein
MLYINAAERFGLMALAHDISLPEGAVWLAFAVDDPRHATVGTGFRKASGEEIEVKVLYHDAEDIDEVIRRIQAEARRLAAQ